MHIITIIICIFSFLSAQVFCGMVVTSIKKQYNFIVYSIYAFSQISISFHCK